MAILGSPSKKQVTSVTSPPVEGKANGNGVIRNVVESGSHVVASGPSIASNFSNGNGTTDGEISGTHPPKDHGCSSDSDATIRTSSLKNPKYEC